MVISRKRQGHRRTARPGEEGWLLEGRRESSSELGRCGWVAGREEQSAYQGRADGAGSMEEEKEVTGLLSLSRRPATSETGTVPMG